MSLGSQSLGDVYSVAVWLKNIEGGKTSLFIPNSTRAHTHRLIPMHCFLADIQIDSFYIS